MDEITNAPAPITLKVWETVRNSIKNIFHNFTPKALAIAAFGLFYIIGLLLTIIINILLAGAHLSDLYYVYTLGIINTIGSVGSPTFTIFFASMVVFGGIMLILLSFLLTSLIKLSLAEEKMSLINSLRGGFKQKIKVLGLLISAYFISTFSAVVFLIPGIYYFVALSLAMFLFIDQGTTVKQSILKSIYYVKGVWFRVFAVLIFSMILMIIFSVAATFILTVIAKILSSIQILQRAVLWVSGILTFLIGVVSAVSMISVSSTIYKTLKTKSEGEIGNSLQKPILIACIGLGLWIGLMYFITVTTQNSLDSMKEKATKAATMNEQSNQADMQSFSDQINAEQGGGTQQITVDGKDVNLFRGFGIAFNYDKDWKRYAANSSYGADATFSSKNSDETDSYADLFITNLKEEGPDSYTLQTDYRNLLEKKKQSGAIENYTFAKWPQNKNVAVIEIRLKGKNGVEVVDKRYSIVLGKIAVEFSGISPLEKAADTDQKLQQMISSVKLDI
ncbi:MAG: hypothetical protein V4469_02265 [Patescibacteria group bacterium]